MKFKSLIIILITSLSTPASAQNTSWFQWTFLDQEQMDEIIGETSGETAFHHILEMAGYNRDRKPEEYTGTFHEASYVFNKLKEYGLPESEIVRFPGGSTWDGIKGELWETSPIRQKLASFQDIRAMLATGSGSADITAALVWIGEGDPQTLAELELKEKIVVTSASPSRILQTACEKMGAAGIISFYSPRPLFDPLIIPWNGLRGGENQNKFAFFLPPREGHLLRNRLIRGEKITVHAQVESAMRKYQLQDVTCAIPGSDPKAGEIILTAHLFEGYAKQGANDNISGCAALLEMARTLNVLIQEGRLPRPARTIRFLWAPEYSGTIPWVNRNLERMKRTLCNINLDMVGLKLAESRSFMTVMRTTFGNPHYINDVMENFYRYMGESNRDYVTNGMNQTFSRRIVSPSGTEDPFIYYMGTHMGSSDHEVFNDWAIGVPGVVLNTWPDRWFHTSEDRPDKIDPTQMKRCVIIIGGAAFAIASADDQSAVRIGGEMIANASARMGHQLARGIEELKRADSAALENTYKRARSFLQASSINERATLETLLELASESASLTSNVKSFQENISQIELSYLKALEIQMKSASEKFGVKAITLRQTDLEGKAENWIPRPTEKISAGGYRSYQNIIEQTVRNTGRKTDRRFSRTTVEIQLLCNGINSALDIKRMLDTQFPQETELEAVMDHLLLLKAAGLIDMETGAEK